MIVLEVHDKKSAKEFIELPAFIYRNDKQWIPSLEADVESVFDPRVNHFFQHGICSRWVLYDDRKKPVGRIAAFINSNKKGIDDLQIGGMGFFECINNTEAAFKLLDTAKKWLLLNGMTAMDAPINFGENDKYWGLLIEGFHEPTFGMNYNPPYYRQFFEAYGFQKAYDQYTNVLDATVDLPERFTKISDWVMKKPQYSFRHFSFDDKEKFFSDFQEIYNDAWSDFENFSQIDIDNIRNSFRQMKAVMDERIIWFAYSDGEPVAFVICLPDINQVFRHLNGKLHLINKLRFLWYKKTVTINRLRIIVMGCKKKFQNHGIESALIRCLQKEVLPRKTIKEVELAWVGDFNSKMIALHEAAGAKKSKVHRTYRYVF
jgi:hypothetical protein